MIEEELLFEDQPQDMIKALSKEGIIDELDKKGFKINYFGENNSLYFKSLSDNYPVDVNNIEKVQSNLSITEDTRNYIIFIKYKNIYIGGLSIFDFQSKEGFGLYKYLNSPDPSFYLGQWEENQKSGIGFLKIDNNHLYFGNFINNQIEGEGIYYNKHNGNFYYGLFSKGIFNKGIYCNLTKDIYYIGAFKNNKKNDSFCCFFNSKKNRLFLGKIKNDLFIKGYIAFLKIKETEKESYVEIERTVHYDRSNQNVSPKISLKNTNEQFELVLHSVLQAVEPLKPLIEDTYKNFDDLEDLYNDDSYNNAIGRYNSYENDYSFENDLVDNYNSYFTSFQEILNAVDIKKLSGNLII